MIKLNDIEIPQNRFPDGTLLMKIEEYSEFSKNTITWLYEGDEELFTLVCLTRNLQDNGRTDIDLYMPYIPHARQDRVHDFRDVFTLKYFCEIINSLNFTTVKVLDAHSDVSVALLNRVEVINPWYNIIEAMRNIHDKDLVFYYPDAGAAKRYGGIMNGPYAYGNKKRDWNTGEILGLEVVNAEIVKDKNVLIIDDICSKGGTFYHSAKALKEAGAKDIYLYVSHCENTILKGELLKDNGLIKKIYTTDSIFTEKHEKIALVKENR